MEQYLKNIIEKGNKELLTDEMDQRFSFFSLNGWFSGYFGEELAVVLKQYIGEPLQQIRGELETAFYQKVYSVTIRTLIYELYQWKEKRGTQPEPLTSSQSYLVFCRQYREETVLRAFCEKYVVILPKIYQMHRYTLELIRGAAAAAYADREELEARLGFLADQICKIELSDGDSHNNGKTALFFSDRKGRRIIYKPHTLAGDIFLEKLYAWLGGKLSYDLRAPLTIDRRSYGWQEFVLQKDCEDEEQYRRYYYRYGEMLCVAYCLHMTDLHHENLILCKDNPVIIDTETIITNDSYNFDKDKVAAIRTDTPEKLFQSVISGSVVNTLLLPNHILGGIFDVDISPFAAYDRQKSERMTRYVVKDDFTDNIHVEQECYEPEPQGQMDLAHNPFHYLEELLGGFTECYEYILQHKDSFLEWILTQAAECGLVVRQVLRPTYVYVKFADASNHPDYLQDFDKQAALLAKLKSRQYAGEEKLSRQADMEIAALLNGDVPYFYEEADSRALHSLWGSIENFYRKSILDLIKEKIEKLSRDDLITQQRLIRLSMSTLLDGNWNYKSPRSLGGLKKYMLDTTGDDMALVGRIADYLCHEAVWDESRSFCILPAHAILDPKLKMASASYNLYDGGGTLLFLYLFSEKSGNGKYREVAEGLLCGYERSYLDETAALSAYNGAGSMLYLYHFLYERSGEARFYQKYHEYLDRIERRTLTDEEPVDYINGLAGMAVLCANLCKKEKDARLERLACAYTDYCLAHLEQLRLAGLAHGYAGVILAVAGCYQMTGEEKYLKKAEELLKREDALYDPGKNNWRDLREGSEESDPVYWCHGAAGILVSRLWTHQYTGLEACLTDAAKCMEKIKTDMMKLRDHSLCHGMMGNVDCLLSCLGLPGADADKVSALASRQYDLVMRDIRDNGIVCGISNAYDMFSFMLGLPGMAYAILRRHDKSIPGILFLE